MFLRTLVCCSALAFVLASPMQVWAEEHLAEAVTPTERVALFNGRDLTGLYSWLKKTQRVDSRQVFSVQNGQIHISGDDFGYLATERAYRDYHLTLEFKWGKKTDGGKYVRNSGLLLHGIGPDGSAGGTWMACVECQLAQGCVGDLIVIRGKNERGETIPVELTSDIKPGTDKRPRWHAGGEKTVFTNRQLWWHQHDPEYEELLDTRGKNDLESPLGEYTKVECLAAGDRLSILVNGTKVNECYNVFPRAGKILLQCEGFELWVRKFEIAPLEK